MEDHWQWRTRLPNDRALKSVLDVHAAATEAGGLAAGVKARDGLATGGEALAVEGGPDVAEGFTCQHPQAHSDERAFRGVGQLV